MVTDRPARLTDAPVLGELLLQRGLLTVEQLSVALVEQRRSERRLGDVIVELGFATAPAVAQALATQHGGLLRTEYGIAVGFDADAEPADHAHPPGAPPDAVAAAPDASLPVRADVAQLESERDAALASHQAALAETGALRAEVMRLQAELQVARQELSGARGADLAGADDHRA